jgi:hypothetical protein
VYGETAWTQRTLKAEKGTVAHFLEEFTVVFFGQVFLNLPVFLEEDQGRPYYNENGWA